jgi:hypothetical protein
MSTHIDLAIPFVVEPPASCKLNHLEFALVISHARVLLTSFFFICYSSLFDRTQDANKCNTLRRTTGNGTMFAQQAGTRGRR